MVSVDGQVALVFGGEIYNYLEVADELERAGHRLRPCGDSAVLLAAFTEWGPACVQRLRGMWSFAAFDRRSGRLTLSRDRFGIKPLYYTCTNGAVAFSSEIKGLLPVLPTRPRGSAEEVVRLLAWGRSREDGTTLFEDVRELPAGCNLHVDIRDGSQKLERFYELNASNLDLFDGSLDEAVVVFRDRLEESVRLHMRSDVRVGACLSGGIDSSITAALATKHLARGRLATFTAVYDDPRIDERRFVEQQSSRNGKLETFFVSPSSDTLMADVDRLVWAQDEPIASTSPFAQWSVMRLASEHETKVLLDGQGADESLGGYSYFAGAFLIELLRAGQLRRMAHEWHLLRDRRRISVWREVGRAGYHQLPGVLQHPARRLARVGYRLISRPFRELVGDPGRIALRTFNDFSLDALRHSLPELLRYEDRSSMAFSIESRVPFLDHRLVELCLSLPTHFKIRDGWSKFIQRRASENLLPPEIAWRRDKLGFATPQAEWKRSLAAPLAAYIGQVDLPAFIDRSQVDAMLSSSRGGAVRLSDFWKVVFLLKWIDRFGIRFSD
jgi:asparagine synthase (glutamine-hydrolysing)